MGSVLYDFLADSFLFDERLIESNFAGITDEDLRRELETYRAHSLEHLAHIRQDIPRGRENAIVFAGTAAISVADLIRTALYVDAYILNDPLFRFTHQPGQIGRVMVESLGLTPGPIDRAAISDATRFMRDLTPMVAGDYVKFQPLALLSEPPEEIPIRYSDTYFSDALPAPIMRFFHERAIVRSMKRTERGWLVMQELTPGRGICITFEGHDNSQAAVYHLHEARSQAIDETSGKVQLEILLPDTPPNREYFRAWVYQSTNQAARDLHNQMLAEYALGAEAGGLFLARSRFAFDLLAHLGAASAPGIASAAVTALLDVDLPVLDGVSAADIMRVRKNEEAFQSFRDALERGVRELRLENDPQKLRIKTENVLHELTEIKVRELEQQVASLRRTSFVDAALAVAGLAGAVSTGGASLLATGVAALKGYRTLEEYRRHVVTNPAFMLWKLRK